MWKIIAPFLTTLVCISPAAAQQRWSDPLGTVVGPLAYDQSTDLGKAMAICEQYIVHVPLNPHVEARAYHYDAAHWQRCDAIRAQWEKDPSNPRSAAAAAKKAADEKLLDTISGVKK